MFRGKPRLYCACSAVILTIAACGSAGARATGAAPARQERFVDAVARIGSAPTNAANDTAPDNTLAAGSQICRKYLGPSASFVGAATAGAVARIATQSAREPGPWSQVPPGELVAQCEYSSPSTSTLSIFVDAAGRRTQTPGMRPLP